MDVLKLKISSVAVTSLMMELTLRYRALIMYSFVRAEIPPSGTISLINLLVFFLTYLFIFILFSSGCSAKFTLFASATLSLNKGSKLCLSFTNIVRTSWFSHQAPKNRALAPPPHRHLIVLWPLLESLKITAFLRSLLQF